MPQAAKSILSLKKTDIERFWVKVDKRDNISECWEWNGHTCHGYGHFRVNKRIYKAHRLAFLLGTQKKPGKLLVCHKCDNRKCCNPNHLFLGTNSENMIDMRKKGRAARRFGESHHSYINPECMARGESGGMSKLTNNQVLEMRKIYAKGGVSYKKMGEKYGVDISVARRIIIREIWKHI